MDKVALPYESLEHGEDFYKESFVVNWTLFNVCNFSCSYCVPQLYDGSVKALDFIFIAKFISKVFKARPGQKIFFEFTGGEVTHYKYFKETFSAIKKLGGHTGLISNGSKSVQWWEEHSPLIDHACLSFHPEKGDPQHFYDVVTKVHGKLSLHVNIMMLPEKFDELIKFAEKLAAEVEGISIALQPLFENFSGPIFNYSEEQLKRLKTPDLPFGRDIKSSMPMGHKKKIFRGGMLKVLPNGQTETADPTLLISNQENSWQGWKCMAGVENIVVNMRGQIFRGLCAAGGPIGHILDQNLSLPVEGIICPKKSCTCAFDIMSTKNKT